MNYRVNMGAGIGPFETGHDAWGIRPFCDGQMAGPGSHPRRSRQYGPGLGKASRGTETRTDGASSRDSWFSDLPSL